jgi:hypothetical protein
MFYAWETSRRGFTDQIGAFVADAIG